MKLIQDLREFIELLNSENVRYLVIGGWAYNRYAEPRVTGDIDFFVEKSAGNEKRIRAVLRRFGFGSVLPPPRRSLFQKDVVMLGEPPYRIDLIAKIDGITFGRAWGGREKGLLDGIPVWFIGLSDLMKNKKAAGREKDRADLAMLRRMMRAGAGSPPKRKAPRR